MLTEVIVTGHPTKGVSFPWGTIGPNQKKAFGLNAKQLALLDTAVAMGRVSYAIVEVESETEPEEARDTLETLYESIVGNPLVGDLVDPEHREALVEMYESVLDKKAGRKYSKTLVKELRGALDG